MKGTFEQIVDDLRKLDFFSEFKFRKRDNFLYRKTDWGRPRARKLPGCSWQTTLYDSAGKAVMSQDGNMRSRGKALFRLTDAFGRECVTGIANRSLSVARAQLEVNILAERDNLSSTLGGYAVKNNTLDLSDAELLSVTYYDDYGFIQSFGRGRPAFPELAYRALAGYDSRFESRDYPAVSTRGMLTGGAVRILGDTAMLYHSVYYDCHGNVIQTHRQNALGGCDHCYYRLTFTGKPLEVRHEHCTPDTACVSVYSYTYDSCERLLSVTLSQDGGDPVLLASNTYDELGQLHRRRFGADGLNSVQYTYNVRGWTSGISSQHFKQTLHYQDAYNGSTPCYNGNVSAAEWEGRDAAASTSMLRHHYLFGYDGLDRLVSAGYCCPSATAGKAGIVQLSDRDFSCQYAYDLNGNMTSLQRSGVTDLVAVRGGTVCNYGKIDNLTLSYSGNQLKSVTDLADDLTYSGAMDFRDGASGAAEYTYDANGNLTSDRNKGIVSITYNELNLPRKVSFGDGHETLYTYASDGTKLRTEYRLNNLGVLEREPLRVRSAAADVANSAVITDEAVAPYTTLTRRDYCGNYVYCNGRLERVLTPGGYISGGEQHFYITDYQGNVRVVLDSAGRPVEVNSYYPYGALTGAGQSVQPYKYGAKELDRENGLNLYDSQARHYDPILGRTTTLDPKATEYFSISPYAWCAGNPVKFVDPDGCKIIFVNGKIGFGSPEAGQPYWRGQNSSFVKKAQSFFNDSNIAFTNLDYDLLSTAYTRQWDGYIYAKNHYNEWEENMNSDETFKLVSHSMGGAFSKGIEKYIKEQGRKVEYNLMINSYQTENIDNPKTKETFYIDYKNTDDPVIFILDNFKPLKNANLIIREETSEDNLFKKHRYPIDSDSEFWKKLKNELNFQNHKQK